MTNIGLIIALFLSAGLGYLVVCKVGRIMEDFVVVDGNALQRAETGYNQKEKPDYGKFEKSLFSWDDTVKSILSLATATVLSLFFDKYGFTDANIITVYILGVLITSVVTEHMLYGVLSSVASVFIFNYLFTEPRYTLLAYDIGYPMTFLVMLLASLLTGTLAARMKNFARQSARYAYRTKILLDTNQLLQQAPSKGAILQATVAQLSKLTGRRTAIYLPEDRTPEELEKSADKSRERYYPIRQGNAVYGTVGVDVKNNPVDSFENSILMSVVGECALALENEKNLREKEEAALLAQNEQLRANLLRAISHDLRTPLTSILGNASNLLANDGNFPPEVKQQLYTDIQDDSMWLINLIENLLSVTRMEGEGVKIHTTAEVVEEVITEALKHVDRKSAEHTIVMEDVNELLLARMDAKLIIQVIINLVNNAIKYTPEGSTIRLAAREEGRMVKISVEDNGPGIPDEIKPQIFELFYTGDHLVTDGRRSMGLGLALCRSIVTAHGGEITVSDAQPQGAVFTFTLPMEEVHFYE